MNICNININKYKNKVTVKTCREYNIDNRNVIKRAILGYNLENPDNKLEEPDNEVLNFIAQFFYTSAIRISQKCNTNYSDAWEASNNFYRSGYCFHFANILKSVFQRGEIVWMAPFSHIAWEDTDGIVYDCEGKYCGEAFYAIPEKYCGESIMDFSHREGIPDRYRSKEELIEIVKYYCKETNTEYDSSIENWFKND
jgi:hypothetical protein